MSLFQGFLKNITPTVIACCTEFSLMFCAIWIQQNCCAVFGFVIIISFVACTAEYVNEIPYFFIKILMFRIVTLPLLSLSLSDITSKTKFERDVAEST